MISKFLKILCLSLKFQKLFSITRTIFSHSWSEQFWWQNSILACKIKSAQSICHFVKDCSYKEQMRSAHALARMIDRDAVASGSYFVVGSIVIGLKVISNNPLDNLPTKCPLQSSKAYKQVGSITLSEWLEMYYILLYTKDIVQDMQLEINRICI